MLQKSLCPCKTCEERTEGCHSKCDRHKEWRKAYDEEKKVIDERKKRDGVLYGYKIESISRFSGKKR